MLLSIPQPIPWHPVPGREMSDSAGNIVQYTDENLGMICLAVNFHKKIMDVIMQIETLTDDQTIIGLLREATGRVGSHIIAQKLSESDMPNEELDRAISSDLQIPVLAYTSSTDLSMTLIPAGWGISFTPGHFDPELGEKMGMVVTLTHDERKVVAGHSHLAMAICIAAMRARVE